MSTIGDTLPDLEFSLSDGTQGRFPDYAGRWLVVYFYPKNHTPGCTTEAGDFRDLNDEFEKAGASILGVSRDTVKSHQNFIAKHELPFALISDADEAVCNAFGVIKEKTLYGRKYMGIVRSTFLIDPQQRIAHAWSNVRVRDHARTVLEKLHELTQS